MQYVCINLDDSGKLVATEKVTIYAGLVFTSKKEKDKFITQYRSIVQSIKCLYCSKDKTSCMNDCPEIKHNMIKPKHNRQLMNYIKKYSVLCCVINNDKVYADRKENKASRGRYLDYSIKRLIKTTIKGLIKENRINDNLPIELIINIDEQTTKSNGYYNLKDSIYEELKCGISNFDYGRIYPPIIKSDLELKLHYQKFEKSYLIQASDLIAGTIRTLYLKNLNDYSEFIKRTVFVNYRIILP